MQVSREEGRNEKNKNKQLLGSNTPGPNNGDGVWNTRISDEIYTVFLSNYLKCLKCRTLC